MECCLLPLNVPVSPPSPVQTIPADVDFYFLKPILFPPYLGPYIYRWFHAKFQDSRTNNKKRPPPSDPKRPLAVYTTVCSSLTSQVSPSTISGMIPSKYYTDNKVDEFNGFQKD